MLGRLKTIYKNWYLNKRVKRGMKLGEGFSMQSGCNLDFSHCWLIEIGNSVTFAPKVHVLAHDASTYMFLGYTKIGRVVIGDNVFVGANVTILPNVKIGSNSVIGAGSVVTKDIPDGSVAVGNPAKVIMSLDKYLEKQRDLMEKRPVYGEEWMTASITDERRVQMWEDLHDGIGFVR